MNVKEKEIEAAKIFYRKNKRMKAMVHIPFISNFEKKKSKINK